MGAAALLGPWYFSREQSGRIWLLDYVFVAFAFKEIESWKRHVLYLTLPIRLRKLTPVYLAAF
jgi:hypothetical protein